MAATAQSASFSAIAAAVVEQLAAVTEIDPAYVHLVASDRYRITCLEPRFLYLRYFGLQPDTDAGAGRRARPVYRRFRVYIYTRNSLDRSTDDTVALTAEDGHEALELLTLDALDEHFPKDEDGNLLTIEPLHPLDSSSGPPEREPEDDDGLLRFYQDYQCRYLAAVSNPQP